MKNKCDRVWVLLISIMLVLALVVVSPLLSEDEEKYVKFQDRMSMDWDVEQGRMLMELATYKGGSVEDRAYNIIVTLNRMLCDVYPDTIEENVELEMGSVEIEVDELSRKAMRKVMYERWDETKGSIVYR